MMKGPYFFDMNVEFEDIRFLRATAIQKGVNVDLTIMIHTGTGRFEITEGKTAVVTGFIREVENPKPLTHQSPLAKTQFPMMEHRDFYKELRLRGYHYSGAFRSVVQARGDGLSGKVKWDLNWVSFMDCLLQINILGKDSRSLILPTRIQKMRINAKEHMAYTENLDPANPCFDVQVCPKLGKLTSGGIEIVGMTTSPVGRRKPPGLPVLESYKFIPHLPSPRLSKSDAIRACVQIALENNPVLKVKVVEVDHENRTPITPLFETALGDLPLITADLMLLTKQDLSLGKVHVEDGNLSTQSSCSFVVLSKALSRPGVAESALKSLSDKGYMISRESSDLMVSSIEAPTGLQLIATFPTEDEMIVVFQRLRRRLADLPIVINISDADNTFEWLEKLKTAIKENLVIVVAQGQKLSGIIGLINCIRKEPNGSRVSCVFIDDESAPKFEYNNPFYGNQLKLGLAINVYRNVSNECISDRASNTEQFVIAVVSRYTCR